MVQDVSDAERLMVKIADCKDEIEAAQELRYEVFYCEQKATPTDAQVRYRRDFDQYDESADHLIVIDPAISDRMKRVVGTYRLLRHGAANSSERIYSASEYDVSKLLKRSLRLLELGRSCVAKSHRNRQTIHLLWQAIAEYIAEHDIDVLFGCASFPGTRLKSLRLPLSYLYHFHLAPLEMRPRALDERFIEMNQIPKQLISIPEARFAMPPLIKGYIRLGAHIGDGAVIDHDFATVDVCIVLSRAQINARYGRHYQRSRGALSS